MMKTILTISIFLSLSQMVFAQTKADTSIKVIIIETIIHENGDTTHVEKLMEGNDAENYIKEDNITGDNGDASTEKPMKALKKTESIETNDFGQKIYKYEVVTKENGKKIKLKWEGMDRSEMPEELRAYFEKDWEDEQELDIDIQKVDESKKKVKIKISKDGEDKEYEFESEGKGDDIVIPDEIQEELDAEEIPLQILGINGFAGTPEQPKEKAQLGVMIGEHESGVLITGIIPGSSADDGGLISGDVITKVNDKMTFDVKELINIVSNYYVGDEINVEFIRMEEKMSQKFVLKKGIPRTWQEALNKN